MSTWFPNGSVMLEIQTGAGKPPRMVDAWTLPWQRRERCDANIRRAIGELRALALEDDAFTTHYRALADCFESGLALLDEIEGAS